MKRVELSGAYIIISEGTVLLANVQREFYAYGKRAENIFFITESNQIRATIQVPFTDGTNTYSDDVAAAAYLASLKLVNGLFYTPEDEANKVTTMAGNESSNKKYLSAKAVFDWVSGLGYITAAALSGYATEAFVASQGFITSAALTGYATQTWVNSQGFIKDVIAALGFTPANKAGETFTGEISATNLSGINTGDETAGSIQTKRPLKTINGNSLEGAGNLALTAKAFLTTTQASTSTTLAVVTGHTFTIPPNTAATIVSNLIFTAAATTTGLNHAIRVANPAGASANVVGNAYFSNNQSASAAATSLQDGDAFNVAANANSAISVLGANTTSGNNASIVFANIFNQSTNTSATVTIEFATEVAASAVTLQIGSGTTLTLI